MMVSEKAKFKASREQCTCQVQLQMYIDAEMPQYQLMVASLLVINSVLMKTVAGQGRAGQPSPGEMPKAVHKEIQ